MMKTLVLDFIVIVISWIFLKNYLNI